MPEATATTRRPSARLRSVDEIEVLRGGAANEGAVVRVGAHVLRPANLHSTAVHALLRHVRDQGFAGAPEVVGFEEDGRERLVFVPGDVPLPPFPTWWLPDPVLASMARLLRRFHDATVGFVPAPDATWSHELRDPAPGRDPVLCHNDVCPENVVYRSARAVALIGFEFAAPGRREWDLGAMVMMCAPLDPPDNAAQFGLESRDPVRRARVAADGYGLDAAGRRALVDVVDERMKTAGDFIRDRALAGEPAFVRMWNASGGEARYERRRRWYAATRPVVVAALE
jgi:hypothetical protein